MNYGNQLYISMLKFNIKTIVQTSKKRTNWFKHEFATQPDHRFGGGIGKRELLKFYETQLPEVDRFFEENNLNRLIYQEGWNDFLDDCVAMACLHHFLTNEPIEFVPKHVIEKNLIAVPVSAESIEKWQRHRDQNHKPH
jgi:hypothetical protein